jgi:DnaJ-class molecular chaperone
MLVKEKCADCGGTGITFVETASFLGLVKKQTPVTCSKCGGKGHVVKMPECKYCDGRGLIGNDNAVCRVCNGTGTGDDFAWMPRSELLPGKAFQRVCQVCRQRTTHELLTGIVQSETATSWEEEAGLRKTRTTERVQVHCTECDDTYWIIVDPDMHPEEVTPEMEDFLAHQAGVSGPEPEAYR